MTALRALKNVLYATIALISLICAVPALALESDTEPPVISFTTDDYFRGYPVIHARDVQGGGAIAGFSGFTVTDNDTQYFADMSFKEGRLLPCQGMVKVKYDRDALNGFISPAEGEVEIVATDTAGNTASVKAWCIVRAIDPPYYADSPSNEPNERENRINLYVPLEEAYAFFKEDFITDRLISGSEIAALYIDSLPKNGELSLYSSGEFIELKEADLPLRVTIRDIHAGKLLYTPVKSGADTFTFKLEDIAGNIAYEPSAVSITVKEGSMLINGVEDIEKPVGAEPFTFDIIIDVSNTQIHPSSIQADIAPMEMEKRNAATEISFMGDGVWRVNVTPVPNMAGECEYNISAKSGDEIAISTFTLKLKGDDEGVAVAGGEATDGEDAMNEAPAVRISELTIAVPGMDEWARSAALSARIANHEYISSVVLMFADGQYAGLPAYVLKGNDEGLYEGEVYAVGRYTLVATDISGNSVTRTFQVKNVNNAPPRIEFDRAQLRYGAFETPYLSVNISCATDIADVRILSANTPIEGARAELAAQGEYRLYFEELHDTEVILEVTDAQGLISTLNMGRLTRDISPPVIEVDFPNDENRYYLPRLVRVSDESRVESVTRLEEVSEGVYRIPMSIGADAEEEVTATDSFGNASKIKLTMMKIPNPSRLTLLEDSEEIKATVSAIVAELEMMGDNASLTQIERRKLVEIIEALTWEADALAFIQAEEPSTLMVEAHSLCERLPGIPMISEDIADEFLLRYTLLVAGERVDNSINNLNGAVDNALMRAIEDAVIQSTLVSGGEGDTQETEQLFNIYNNLAVQAGIQTNTEGAFLIGMLSRVDYSPAIGNDDGFTAYFTLNETDQLSQEPPDEDFFFIGAADMRIILKRNGHETEELSFFPGNQGLLCVLAVPDASIYDISTLRMMRVSEGESVELEILRTELTDAGIYLFVPISATGRLELYARVLPGISMQENEQDKEAEQEQTATPEPTPVPTPVPTPEPTPEPEQAHTEAIAPEPMHEAIKQDEAESIGQAAEAPPEQKADDLPATVQETTEAPTNDARSFASYWALYIIGGGTLLIVLLRIIVALKRDARD